ncbi:glycosyltransferase family 2 protein [Paraconexibacter antarcticus]|uniref:Glycosyltransferase family 2 protein n=1 Tax=Paraconexibacter antarcticus TaxID=2949664 RepID=A0ABY5DLK7_9ACTN|nr:glycosyltransferase [Paraconexibacter antarcticus]UTI62720.1 glycosyltransferase family 2 protein [Paraconexibacter antarcticus]
MAVSVIVPARDAALTLPATLAALAAQRCDEPFEVIVVDNGSTDGTGRIAAAAEGVRVVPGPGRGPGPARMAGVAAARHDVLAFTDADCAPEPGWLAAGAAAIRGGAVLAQGWTGPPEGVAPGPWDRTLRVGAALGLFETANLFVARGPFEAAGGFGDGLEAPGHAPFGEDVLLGWALRRQGLATAFVPEARVRHWVFPRDHRGYLAELERRALFAHLVRAVPELRDTLLWGRVFLHRRDAAVCAAAAGVLAGLVTGTRAPVLLGALPWAAQARADWTREGRETAALRAVADAWAVAHTVRGSIQARTLVL